jgi:peptide/nickel transport system substrate-binding protein
MWKCSEHCSFKNIPRQPAKLNQEYIMKKKSLVIVVLILIAGLFLAACNPAASTVVEEPAVEEPAVEEPAVEEPAVEEPAVEEPAAEEPAAEGPAVEPEATDGVELIWGASNSPETLDPHKFSGSQAAQALSNILDTLVWRNPEDNKYYPGLAKSWEQSEDYMTLTLELRDDVTFQDGTPFNAEAVKFTLDRIMDPDTQAAHAAGYMTNYESSEVMGPYTIKINFTTPSPSFLESLTHPSLAPISPTAVEKWGDDFGDHVVGAGPMMLGEWDHEAGEIKLERFEDYHWAPDFFENRGPAYINSMVWKVIEDTPARALAFEAGEVHIVSGLTLDDIARLSEDPENTLWKFPVGGITDNQEFNLLKPPGDDIRVREALVRAVDRKTLNDVINYGLFEVPETPFLKGLVCYDNSYRDLWAYDPERSAELLDEAGWVIGEDGIREKDGEKLHLTAVWWAGDDDSALIYIQSEWKKIGVELEPVYIDYNAFWEEAPKGEYNLYNGSKSGADPDIARLKYSTDAIWNFSHISDPQLDQWLADGLASGDLSERCENYRKVQQYIVENYLHLAFTSAYNLMISTNDLVGLKYRGDGSIMFIQDVQLQP